MTPNQIIEQIWRLKWYQVMKVAVYDDFIVMYKIWPVLIILLVGLGCYLFYECQKDTNGQT